MLVLVIQKLPYCNNTPTNNAGTRYSEAPLLQQYSNKQYWYSLFRSSPTATMLQQTMLVLVIQELPYSYNTPTNNVGTRYSGAPLLQQYSNKQCWCSLFRSSPTATILQQTMLVLVIQKLLYCNNTPTNNTGTRYSGAPLLQQCSNKQCWYLLFRSYHTPTILQQTMLVLVIQELPYCSNTLTNNAGTCYSGAPLLQQIMLVPVFQELPYYNNTQTNNAGTRYSEAPLLQQYSNKQCWYSLFRSSTTTTMLQQTMLVLVIQKLPYYNNTPTNNAGTRYSEAPLLQQTMLVLVIQKLPYYNNTPTNNAGTRYSEAPLLKQCSNRQCWYSLFRNSPTPTNNAGTRYSEAPLLQQCCNKQCWYSLFRNSPTPTNNAGTRYSGAPLLQQCCNNQCWYSLFRSSPTTTILQQTMLVLVIQELPYYNNAPTNNAGTRYSEAPLLQQCCNKQCWYSLFRSSPTTTMLQQTMLVLVIQKLPYSNNAATTNAGTRYSGAPLLQQCCNNQCWYSLFRSSPTPTMLQQLMLVLVIQKLPYYNNTPTNNAGTRYSGAPLLQQYSNKQCWYSLFRSSPTPTMFQQTMLVLVIHELPYSNEQCWYLLFS